MTDPNEEAFAREIEEAKTNVDPYEWDDGLDGIGAGAQYDL